MCYPTFQVMGQLHCSSYVWVKQILVHIFVSFSSLLLIWNDIFLKDLILIICKSERDHNLLCHVMHTSFFLLFWKAFLGFLGAGESSFTTTGISGIASSFNAALAPGYPSSASLAGSLLYWLFVKCFPHILLYFEGVKSWSLQ